MTTVALRNTSRTHLDRSVTSLNVVTWLDLTTEILLEISKPRKRHNYGCTRNTSRTHLNRNAISLDVVTWLDLTNVVRDTPTEKTS